MDNEDRRKTARTPTGRFGRFARLSSAATGVAARLTGQRLLERLLPKDQRQESRRRALAKSGEQMVRVMGNLKGAAMKVGQMLSVDSEVMPPEIREALATLQRSAPPMDYDMVVRQVEQAFDRPISDLYKYFHPEPIGAASIGQVHRAETFDGEIVAVKIQYPGIASSIDSDLKNLASLMLMAGVVAEKQRIDEYVEEAKQVLIEESDYLNEAANLDRYSKLLADRAGVAVPKPVLNLCCGSVLTMDFVDGVKLDEHLEGLPVGTRRNELAERFVRLMATMFHDLHVLHADPHPGNFLVDKNGTLVLLDFGCVRVFPETFTDGVLDVLVALWQGDAEALVEHFRTLNFGTGRWSSHKPEAIYELSELILEPFLDDAPFDFGAFDVKERMRSILLQNFELTTFVPPREALLYLRVVAGLRGLLKRLEITFNAGGMAREIAVAHGKLE